MLEEIKAILMKICEKEDLEIKPESNLVLDLELNSLDVIYAVAAFEEAFKIEVPDTQIHRLVTVQDIMDFVESEKGQGTIAE